MCTNRAARRRQGVVHCARGRECLPIPRSGERPRMWTDISVFRPSHSFLYCRFCIPNPVECLRVSHKKTRLFSYGGTKPLFTGIPLGTVFANWSTNSCFFSAAVRLFHSLCHDASRSRARGEEVACVCVRAESRTCKDRAALSRSLRIPHIVRQLRVGGDQAEQQT